MSDPIRPVTVVGIGADGWMGLGPEHRDAILNAKTIIGSERHLALLPEVADQCRFPLPRPLRAGLVALLAGVGDGVVVLASGDPLVSGIGSTLIDLLDTPIRILPSISSVALARARLGWPAESCAVVSLVGRHPATIVRELAPGRRVLVLSADENTPAAVAQLLTEFGYGTSMMRVLGEVGSPAESSLSGTAQSWTAVCPRLNMIGLELVGPLHGAWVAGLPDEAFEHDGQITKRDFRASALARLAPVPGQHLWDVGAGAGSIGIEWMRSHPSCTATAIEVDARRAARIERNAAALGVPMLRVIRGEAPAALKDLESPSAIFIGGGATTPGVLDRCLEALPPDGRLVVHGVTVETERIITDQYTVLGGELTRMRAETAAPLGSYTGWAPTRTVTQWVYITR